MAGDKTRHVSRKSRFDDAIVDNATKSPDQPTGSVINTEHLQTSSVSRFSDALSRAHLFASRFDAPQLVDKPHVARVNNLKATKRRTKAARATSKKI